MYEADGCLDIRIQIGKKYYKRIPYGEDFMFYGDERCPDCACKIGHFHHFGCDHEQCPKCGRQLIMCTCKFTGNFKIHADP